MSLYTIKSGFQAIKFDDDFNVEAIYGVSKDICTCPAGHLSSCRHREMLEVFQEADKVDSGWFLDWDKVKWHEPLGESDD